MPIYTYRCKNCGVQFDQQQKFSDTPLIRCPECAKKTLQKVYQSVGVVFKGSGFYATDHRSPSGSARAVSKSSEGGESKSNESNEKSSSSSEASSEKSNSKSDEKKE